MRKIVAQEVILFIKKQGYVVYYTINDSRGLADDEINDFLSPLVNYDFTDSDIRREVPCNNRFTVQALNRLGLRWSITDMEYLEWVPGEAVRKRFMKWGYKNDRKRFKYRTDCQNR